MGSDLDRRFCVYAHFVEGEASPFYIGEGTARRSRDKFNRNRHWNFKVAKHSGFRVEVLCDLLTKAEAEQMERELIAEMRKRWVPIVNVCDGPMYDGNWLVGKPKELHPMFGKRFTAPWIAESNTRRKGLKQKPRPDLSARNKAAQYKHYTRPVRCVETGQIFESARAAEVSIGVSKGKVTRAVKQGYRTMGFSFEYVSNERQPAQSKPEKKSTLWRNGKLPTTTGGAVPFINVK